MKNAKLLPGGEKGNRVLLMSSRVISRIHVKATRVEFAMFIRARAISCQFQRSTGLEPLILAWLLICRRHEKWTRTTSVLRVERKDLDLHEDIYLLDEWS